MSVMCNGDTPNEEVSNKYLGYPLLLRFSFTPFLESYCYIFAQIPGHTMGLGMLSVIFEN